MKMLPKHYTIMAVGLDAIRDKIIAAGPMYHANGLSGTRFRWGFFRMAHINGDSTRWQCDTLYPYLNDAQVDTALRHYFRGQFGGEK